MSIGVPELIILVIVALGIGVTTLVVVIIAMVVLRQRGGRFSAPADPDEVEPPRDPERG